MNDIGDLEEYDEADIIDKADEVEKAETRWRAFIKQTIWN